MKFIARFSLTIPSEAATNSSPLAWIDLVAFHQGVKKQKTAEFLFLEWYPSVSKMSFTNSRKDVS